jgi:H+-translocating NAD(P) transhydrogenase subunit alpha
MGRWQVEGLTEGPARPGGLFRALDKPPAACHKTGNQIRGAVRVDFISILSIFVLACFVGYYVVWSVTPALHTPLMSVTNAISSVIVVGALIAAAAAGSVQSKWLGLVAVALASVNIFGGFAVTQRMLSMYRKKERK